MDEKYSFYVNGQLCVTDQEVKLIRYLRDELGLTSVKDGCSEGACGTCTIVVDGKATRACVLTTKKAEGKHILTVEGLSGEEKEAFVYAFGSKGSVQCGFCIPGMVMSAKALIDVCPDPDEEEIKKALKGNICRCTGYKKIIEGIQLAAAILRGDAAIDPEMEKGDSYGVGAHAFRVDVRQKVLGYGEYPDDIYMDGMVHASALRSAYPRARILKIDTSEAEKLPGVLRILTARDVPNNKVGHLQQDWDVMIAEGSCTRCVGDAICLVVAETRELCEEAKKRIHIEYEVLAPVRNIKEASADDAPKVHSRGNLCQSRHVTRGDAAKALSESAFTVTGHFSTPFTEHAFLEPECAVAFPYKDGIKIFSTDQGAYDTRKETAIMFGWEPERVVVENKLIGGGFGGKEDVSVQHLAALAAYYVQRPVKAKLSRQESINFHPKRHAMEGDFTIGCDENGILTGLDCEIHFDTGAYASLCGPVLERACTHSVGPYCYQNTDIRGYGWYTNNPPAGAFRGFGVCQSEFALESLLNLLAEKVGISPWEIRYRNAIEPGKVLPNGQFADCSTALKETLLAVKDVYEKNRDHAGIACAMKNAGVGVGLPDKGRARLEVEDGCVVIYCAASDIGQGSNTVMCQMVAETTGLPLGRIRNAASNTENAPDSGTTSGSRQTLLSGEAVRGAAFLLGEAILHVNSANDDPIDGSALAACLKDAEYRDGMICSEGDGSPLKQPTKEESAAERKVLSMSAEEIGEALRKLEGTKFYYEYFEPTDKLGADLPNPKSHIAYGYATHVVILDDEGRVSEVYAAHDSGKVVNPISIQGQIEGGVLMGMGYALTEDFPLEDCVPKAKFGTLGLFRAPQIPEIHAIYVEKEELLPVGYGAKGIGEIATIPTAPAVQGAYYAMDHKFRTKLPMDDTYYRRSK